MSRYAEKEWKLMLGQLASRDASVELSRRTANANADADVPEVSYRTRMFAVDDEGCIIVERPRQVGTGADESFGTGDDIELLLMQNNERIVGTCTIKEVFLYDVNPTMRVCCYRLSPARRPQLDQRRSFYRVNIAALDLDPVTLRHEEEGFAFDFQGRMVNLSAGGLGVSVRLSRNVLNQIKKTRDYRCIASFDNGQSIDTTVRVAHISALGDDGLYLGLQFSTEDEAESKHIEDNMHQLCLHYQRQAIKRQRA